MSIIPWPTGLLPSDFQIELAGNTQSGGRSPFDGTEQTLELPGSPWVAELSFEGLPEEEHRPLLAFLSRLNGRSGRFSWAPPLPRRATATGTVTIGGAGQTGKVLATAGWPATVVCARLGDFLSWDDGTGRTALHQVVADPAGDALDVASNGAGQCAFTVAPALRRSPPNGGAVNYAAPTAIWKLSQDRGNGLRVRRGLIAGGTLQIEEALW